jgi:ComF family protein
MSELIDKILEGFFPKNFTCDICNAEVFNGKNLCPSCALTVHFNDGNTCPVCGRKTTVSQLCFECKDYAPSFKRAVSALIYSDGTVTLVHKFKKGNGYLKEYFADILKPLCAHFEGAEGVVCVPMTKKAEKERGYNQSELLAKALAKRLDLPYIKRAMNKVKQTPPQKTLTRKEREKNLTGCFKADKKLVDGKTLIVVDDVLTTGATANAICDTLKKAGAKAVYFATVASVEYKREL